MEDDLLKHLYDIKQAAAAILRFVRGETFADYERDELLRSGVERKFEIIGEALNRFSRDNPTVLDKIREHRNIVSCRNIRADGYDSIDNRIVWDISGKTRTNSSKRSNDCSHRKIEPVDAPDR